LRNAIVEELEEYFHARVELDSFPLFQRTKEPAEDIVLGPERLMGLHQEVR
jgi:hypothetical protein